MLTIIFNNLRVKHNSCIIYTTRIYTNIIVNININNCQNRVIVL